MKNNTRLVGTLLAAALLGAGSASAQTTNTNSQQPRGVIGGTLGALGLGGAAQRMYSPSTYNMPSAPRGGLVRGLVGGVLRPVGAVGRMGASPMSGSSSSHAPDDSLPGLAEADERMRDDASRNESGAEPDSAAGSETEMAAADSGSDSGSEPETQSPGEIEPKAEDGMSGAEGSRQSGTTQRTSSDYRGNREQESRVLSVGFQVGRASTRSSEQQVRRGSRTQMSGSEAQYTAPSQTSEQNAGGSGQPPGNQTSETSTEPATSSNGSGSTATSDSGQASPGDGSSGDGSSGSGQQTASASDTTPTPGSSSSTSEPSQ